VLIELDVSLRGNAAVLKTDIFDVLQLIVFAGDRSKQGLATQNAARCSKRRRLLC